MPDRPDRSIAPSLVKAARMYWPVLLAAWLAGTTPVPAGEREDNAANGLLRVTVSGLATDDGAGHFALYDSAAAYDAGQPADQSVSVVTNGLSQWSFAPLPAGVYVVTFFHDINANNRLDRTGPGIPVEPIAFSNDVRPRFGPPRYDRMKFEFDGGNMAKELTAFTMLGRRGRIGIGAGMVVNQSPYERGGARVVTIPALTYVGSRLSLLGAAARLRLGTMGPADLHLQARYSFERFDTDSEQLAGLRRRRDTVMGGAGLRLPLPAATTLDLAAETDLLDTHAGQRSTARVARSWQLGAMSITPSAGVEWLAPAISAHRYGVTEAEAGDRRPAYRPGAALNWNLGLGARYMLGDATALIANGTLTVLDPDIKDSPIVIRNSLFSLFLALTYSL